MNDEQETNHAFARSRSNVGLGAWKVKRRHKNLGDVFITIDCLAMQLRNPDPTSIFVEHDGEIKEVSRSMIEAPNIKVRGCALLRSPG